MDDMDAHLWSKLPEDLGDRPTSFLPVPVLCRFRTVCKRGNVDTRRPTVQVLRMQNASPNTCYLARLTSMEQGQGKFQAWGFFEMAEKRRYTIAEDQQVVIGNSMAGPLRTATNGGLVCELWEADYDDDNMQGVRSIVASNPVAKASTLLPPFPYPILPECARVNMAVDSGAQAYKAYVDSVGFSVEFYGTKVVHFGC